MSEGEQRSGRSSEDETLPPRSQSPSAGRSANSDNQPFADEPTLGPSPIQASSRFADVPGYELQHELGRGGMGVVYKARDQSLDRTVAIKMIIAGKLASEEDVRRFRLEAEAAARLDHPGIVPIYDIGEVDGNHFFAMKYVEGAALADRADLYRGDYRAAVTLLIEVAKAVHHAHQRGVLHRDLKPANVLVAEDGKPLVTDLGLAKKLDGDGELTQTGLVMGTPGFMAPEQASGSKEITTAADVFSLGAILHWLVTGFAPFRGETPLQVIMQTVEGSLPSLRKSMPGIDLGLELICQKCLQKEPNDRYSSAAALAEDLQAWLDNEPLSVRPPSAVTLAKLWFRKNLRTVVGTAVCGVLCGFVVAAVILMSQLHRLSGIEQTLSVLAQPTGSQWPMAFQSLRRIPVGWLNALQFAMVGLLFVAALASALFVRPRSREACIAYSLTVGLLAGVIAHTMVIGWGPVVSYAIERGRPDIVLLSDAIFHETETERQLARKALEQRYPGLAKVPLEHRGTLLSTKITHDQLIGVPWGMWVGISVTLFLVTLPLTFCSAIVGFLWVAGKRGWALIGLAWERSIYTMVMFFTAAVLFVKGGPLSAGIVYESVFLLTLILALILSYRDARWYWRVGAFLLTTSLMSVSMAEAGRIDHHWSLADQARTPDEIIRAAKYHDKYLAQRDNSLSRFHACILWLAAGNEERYQEHCRRLLNDFENAYQPQVADRIAKVALLRPDLQDKNDLPMIHELAEFASGFESNEFAMWFFFGRALSEQRRGNLEATLEWNQRSRDAIGEPRIRADLAASTHVVDALAHRNAGDRESADAAIRNARTISSHFEDPRWATSWENRLFYELLLDESSGDHAN